MATSANLPGILGWEVFGQPLWKILNNNYLTTHSYSIRGNAIIINPSILQDHRSVNITGNAVIIR